MLGCGSIGLRHLRNLRALGARDLVAHDPSAPARAQAAEAGARPVDDLAEVWAAKPWAVVVASPTQHHVQHARAALEGGCHVFVEKPLGHQLEGTDGLCAAASASRLTTLVGCNMRFHPGPAQVKRLLDEGAVGTVLAARLKTGSYLPDWRPRQDHRASYSASPEWGGAILDCIHEIDLALWLLGPARLVGAAILPGRSIGLEADGLAELLLRHASGSLSSVHLNFVQRNYRRCIEVVGTEGTVDWDFVAGRVVLHGARPGEGREFFQPPAWAPNDMYLDEMRHFLDCARGGRACVNPLAGGVAALEVALAAREAGR